jgi:transcriptional regulator with XRE-family HTH domain
MTQQPLGQIVGGSVPYLSQIETGKRSASTKVLLAISKALRVDVDELLTKSE